MNRRELEELQDDELAALAKKSGLPAKLTRAEVIEQLATDEPAEKSGEKPGDKRAEKAEKPAAKPGETQPRSLRPPRMPSRGTFDIPSSTVHPHADELETLTMARRYLAEGQLPRALEILEKLVALDPDDEKLVAELAEAKKQIPATKPEPAPATPADEGPREPMWMLDLEELPETYGIDECEVLYKDPWWVFAYWEVTDGGLDAARAQLGPSAGSARLVLRLFTTTLKDEHAHREVHDIDLGGRHGRRYLPSVKPGAHLRVAVGLLSQEGYFAPIAHSSLVRVPYAEPAPGGPVEWMEVVPPRSRGREKEPLVIVRRGAGEHEERGLGGDEPGKPGSPGGYSSSERPKK
jgi:hypothetical protein